MYKYPEKIRLENEHIVLSPMKLSDSKSLFAAASTSDDELFFHMSFGPFQTEADIETYIRSRIQQTENVTFTVYSKRLQKVVGNCSIININKETGDAEIGSIWYSKEAQNTEINTSVVLRILEYLFEDLQYRRAVWKCDRINMPSKNAAEKLGFEYEGLFRKHMIVKGRNRDTLWYSIIDDEWKSKKKSLEKRLIKKLANVT